MIWKVSEKRIRGTTRLKWKTSLREIYPRFKRLELCLFLEQYFWSINIIWKLDIVYLNLKLKELELKKKHYCENNNKIMSLLEKRGIFQDIGRARLNLTLSTLDGLIPHLVFLSLFWIINLCRCHTSQTWSRKFSYKLEKEKKKNAEDLNIRVSFHLFTKRQLHLIRSHNRWWHFLHDSPTEWHNNKSWD